MVGVDDATGREVWSSGLLPDNATSVAVPRGVLSDGQEYKAWVEFFNYSDGPDDLPTAGKGMESVVGFQVLLGTEPSFSGLGMTHSRDAGTGQEEWGFWAEVAVEKEVVSAAVILPNGSERPLTADADDAETFGFGFRGRSLAEVSGQFPDGEYELRMTYDDDAVWTGTATLGGTYPAVFPQITSPGLGAVLDTLPLTITWQQWRRTDEPNSGVWVEIENNVTHERVWETGTLLPDNATSVGVPADALEEGGIYRVAVGFTNESDGLPWPAAMKGKETGLEFVVDTVGGAAIQVLKAGDRPWAFDDADGDRVTVTFGGPVGLATITREAEGGDIQSIWLANTDHRSSLTITTKATVTEGERSPNNTTVGEIGVGGSLKSLVAKTTDLSGAFRAEGTVGAVALHKTEETLEIGGSVGNISVTGGDFGGVSAVGSIGNIMVVGGNITGSLISENGRIGNITVTGLAVFDTDAEEGEVVGGSILSPEIRAAAVKGKSIGNTGLTAGSFGSDGEAVEVQATGDIGNITVKKLRYKASVTEEEVGWTGGEEGEPIYRRVAHYAYQGGGIWTNLDTPGRLGNVTTCGGDLGGEIHAGKGMGSIVVDSIPASDPEEGEAQTGSLTASLIAEPGEQATAIASIRVTGGSVEGAVNVVG
ncbi:MAG: hypothetical protein FJ272_15200, partial [Planctomycetes bacterium]|nr:hypothetical protein [Planctomycetota bacterium]